MLATSLHPTLLGVIEMGLDGTLAPRDQFGVPDDQPPEGDHNGWERKKRYSVCCKRNGGEMVFTDVDERHENEHPPQRNVFHDNSDRIVFQRNQHDAVVLRISGLSLLQRKQAKNNFLSHSNCCDGAHRLDEISRLVSCDALALQRLRLDPSELLVIPEHLVRQRQPKHNQEQRSHHRVQHVHEEEPMIAMANAIVQPRFFIRKAKCSLKCTKQRFQSTYDSDDPFSVHSDYKPNSDAFGEVLVSNISYKY